MGFNPTHGYKYILKLEKGTVPNPTLRTIVGYLEACGAGWPDVVDVMPGSTGPAPAGPKGLMLYAVARRIACSRL